MESNMIRTAAIVDRYIALWNERDGERRQSEVARLWSVRGAHLTASGRAIGHGAIAARIAREHARFVANGRFCLRPASEVASSGNVVRFDWQMVAADSGTPKATGLEFLILDDEGRIQFDYQFENAPATAI
jgi:hypothetical protein